ncbi:LysE family transporter [Candidatus Dependentiae bacterium]|nr:LysE family transporter [Candidatus Dependentiae bacterium]
MNELYFYKGLIVGIGMAAPIGPISLLCIRRSLIRGHYAGIATALGVAIADGFYALIAAFGLTALSSFLINQKEYIYCVGGLFLIFLGIKAFKTKPISINQPLKSTSFLLTTLQTMLLTLTNPMTIVSFLAVFATLGLDTMHNNITQATLICLGVFCGSGLWFISLSTLAAHFRSRIKPSFLRHINQFSGVFFILCGLFLIIMSVKRLI